MTLLLVYHYGSQIGGCNVTVQIRKLYRYTPNIQLWSHCEISDEHTKLCLSSLTWKLIRYYTLLVGVVERETEYENWVARFRWTKRNSMPWRERERERERETEREREREKTDSHLDFSFWFSFVVLTYYSGFVSTAACLVWDLFSELTRKWRQQHSAVFTLPYLVFNGLSLPRPVSQPTNFQTRVVLLLLPGVGGKNISVSGGSTPAQKIWVPRFFLVIINYCSHSPVPNWSITTAFVRLTQVSWPFRRLSVYLFLLIFLLFLFPQKLASRFVFFFEFQLSIDR